MFGRQGRQDLFLVETYCLIYSRVTEEDEMNKEVNSIKEKQTATDCCQGGAC